MMEHQFWHERWEAGTPPWDQPLPHPALVDQWDALGVEEGAPVFVPLCGTSIDMVWLAERGHRIIGAELSELGVRRFFELVGLEPTVRREGSHEVFESGPYRIWCGDMFEMPGEALADIAATYDRASLVALPPDLRSRYAAFMADRLPVGSVTLLLSFVYDPEAMSGPPFSVDADQVRSLFGASFDVALVSDDDVIDRNRDLAGRGLTWLREPVLKLRRTKR